MSIAVDEQVWPPSVVLYDVDWDLYQKLLNKVREQNVRLTYDQGVLEIMSPLPEHESIKTLIGSFVETLAVEMNIPMAPLGSTTFKRKSLLRGLEPDECYYVQHERDVRGKKRLDLRRDPPPDLVVEVDVSYRTVDKRQIYAAMRVPEIWSYDTGKVQCLHLRRAKYEAREASLAFPFLKPAHMEKFIRMSGQTDETTIRRAWRDWVRRNLPVHD